MNFNAFPPLTLLLFIAALQACQQNEEKTAPPSGPYAHIQDAQARELLRKGIERAGGLEAWNDIRELHFEKYYVLYDSSGTVENEARQTHDYLFQPEEQVNISWIAYGAQHQMVYRDEQVIKMVDGEVDTSANPQSLLNNVLSATFVITIPFKLLDKGTELRYLGLDTLEDDQIVEVLQATYNPDEYDHHSTPDVWHHYFDREDYKLVAYMVQHADHYSYVKNLSYTSAGGFIFPKERNSYRVDSARSILYLRAEYEYTDYEVVPGGSD